jgi:hypothetical protein
MKDIQMVIIQDGKRDEGVSPHILAVKKLDVVGAISSSSGAKYSLQVAVMQILVGMGVCSITLEVSLPLCYFVAVLGGSSIVGSSVSSLV